MPYDSDALWQQWQQWQAGQTQVGKIDPETGGVGRLIETVRQQAPPPVAQQAPPPGPPVRGTAAWREWQAGGAVPGQTPWQAPWQAPEPERPSFLPPEEGKPQWAQEPVPETWGEYPQWWRGRQAGPHMGWWEQAQAEIWAEEG